MLSSSETSSALTSRMPKRLLHRVKMGSFMLTSIDAASRLLLEDWDGMSEAAICFCSQVLPQDT